MEGIGAVVDTASLEGEIVVDVEGEVVVAVEGEIVVVDVEGIKQN